MKERTIRDLSGEIWAELHTSIDSHRDRGDHPLAALDTKGVDTIVDIVTTILTRNVGKTIVRDQDQPGLPLINLYTQEQRRKRRISARRLGVTLQ
jgi:hypothetical protein